MLTVNALNTMIDITNTRFGASEIHPPKVVFAMLAAFAIVCAFLVGFEMGKGKVFSWPHIVGFALTLMFTITVVLDFEYPRFGFIQVGAMDHQLVDLRQTMP